MRDIICKIMYADFTKGINFLWWINFLWSNDYVTWPFNTKTLLTLQQCALLLCTQWTNHIIEIYWWWFGPSIVRSLRKDLHERTLQLFNTLFKNHNETVVLTWITAILGSFSFECMATLVLFNNLNTSEYRSSALRVHVIGVSALQILFYVTSTLVFTKKKKKIPGAEP